MRVAWIFLAALTVTAPVQAAAPAVSADRHGLFFDRVQPLLASRCISCHGPDKQRGGLRLDSRQALLKGGDSGPALRPADASASLLLRVIRHEKGVPAMPPKERLSAQEARDLAAWVRDGATWPDRARVLFEDEDAVLKALPPGDGGGRARMVSDDRHAGKAALAVAGQVQSAQVDGWAFRIREKPGPGEYRYLRFSWKKRGGGAAMLEVANGRQWRTQNQKNAAWVAGVNTTGWDAYSVRADAPAEWATVTRDLWADGGSWKEFILTGLCVTSIGGGEVLLDSVLLGPSVESLDAYKPGRGDVSLNAPRAGAPRGDAWHDPDNPVVKTFKGQRLDLWSLRRAVRPGLPAVRNGAWVRTPVDAFVLARLEARGLKPSPEADRRTLLRRLSFDLIGLPPTPEEIEAFQADRSPDAYEKQVERLLASPHYGERWAQHWLDVVRYGDTNGFERDEFRPDMWRFRDYVVRSLNADKPYDRFVREQLAGDELGNPDIQTAADADRWIATGFLRLGTYDSTAAIFQEEKRARSEVMADLANTTAAAFLGLTYSCCQCHDHKYDPLLQADHYRLRAFFAATRPRDDQAVDFGESGRAIREHNAKLDRQINERADRRQKLLAATGKKKADEARKALAAEDRRRERELGKEIAALQAKKRPLTYAAVMTDGGRSAPPTRILFQGDHTQPRDEVPPGFPSALDPNPAKLPAVPTPTTGRRLALANWIASANNPLTARVMVNRLWQHHFGQGLVATPNDFGLSGARPTHPELLDWLATELPARSWSLKDLHRVMVLSAAYRQSSLDDPARRKADPDNALLWRQRPRRLDAETTRDALLAVSGKLLPEVGGAPRWPAVPEDLLRSQPGILESLKGEDGGRRQGWYTSPAETVDVRSVYLIHKRALAVPLLQPFDLPDPTTSCGRRQVTTVAPQALALLNSPETARLAGAFADRVGTGGTRPLQARRAFRLALGRGPEPDESALAEELLRRHAEKYRREGKADADRRALADLCRALLNLNEFVYID